MQKKTPPPSPTDLLKETTPPETANSAPETGGAPEEPFEETLAKLEKLVARMEDEQLGLEESLRLFKEGMDLVKRGTKRLNEVERKVEILLKDADGNAVVKPFDPEAEEEG